MRIAQFCALACFGVMAATTQPAAAQGLGQLTPPPPLAGPAPTAPRPVAPTAPGEVKPLAFTRMVVKLPVGKVYSVVQQGIFCATTRALTWNGGQSNLAIAPVQDTFRSELIAGGLKPEGDPNNLFESDTTSAEFAVAGMIVDYRG